MPEYGYGEKKTHQDMVFEMAPEIVSDDDNMEVVNGKKVKRKRGKITTGKLGIDLERTMVIREEKDPSIWNTKVNTLFCFQVYRTFFECTTSPPLG
jgi:hypothetical protein